MSTSTRRGCHVNCSPEVLTCMSLGFAASEVFWLFRVSIFSDFLRSAASRSLPVENTNFSLVRAANVCSQTFGLYLLCS